MVGKPPAQSRSKIGGRTLGQLRKARALAGLAAVFCLLAATAQAAGAAGTPVAVSLTASEVTHNSAKLTIANYNGDWHYKHITPAGGKCSEAVSGSSANLDGLNSGTVYVFRAYSDAQCASSLTPGPEVFTTRPGQAAIKKIVGTTKRIAVAWDQVRGATKYRLEWKYGSLGYTADRGVNLVAFDTWDIEAVGAQAYQNHTVRLRAGNASGWGAWSQEASARPVCGPCASLVASDVTHGSAKLTIANPPGGWHYKANAAPYASCSLNAANGHVVGLAGLSGNTRYAFTAYSDGNCSTLLASAGSFLTKPGKPTKPTAARGAGSGKLTLAASVTGSGTLTGWQYRRKEGNGDFGSWRNVSVTSTVLSHVVTGLTDGTNYRFQVRAVNATGYGVASDVSDAARPSVKTLTASNVTAGKATLAIGHHAGNWYYRADAAPDRICKGPVATAATELVGLSPGTSYTYTVYSNSNCSTELATATLRTGPGNATGAPPPAGSSAMAMRLGRLSAALAPEAARAMASSAAAAVSERLRRAGSGEAGPPPARTLAERLAAHGEALEDGTASLREAFAGAALSLPLAAAERGAGAGVSGAGLWASGDWRDLSGGGRPLAWDGAMAALHIGADVRLGSGLVGLALSFSEASFDYADASGDGPVAGEYTARMTGLRPYWGRSWADGSRLWATAGLSSGEVEIEDAEAGQRAADGEMASLAAGGALRLLPTAERGAPSLDLKGEALAARLEVEGDGGAMEAVDAGVSRLRVALASEAEIEAGMPGAPLVPSAELGLVWDGGDGETGAGLELGWGLSWTVPSQGLTLDARARALLGHGGEREEWGAGGGLRLDQGASGRGASFGLALSLGHAEGGAARLWEEGAAAAAGDREGERPPARLDAEGGYGMAAPGLSGGLLTPYAGAGLEDGGGRRYRTGVRLEHGPALSFSLEGARNETAEGGPGHDVMLRLEMRW